MRFLAKFFDKKGIKSSNIVKVNSICFDLLSLTLVVCMTLSLVYIAPYPANAATPELAFNDLDGFEWSADAFAALKTAGIVEGDGAGKVNPGGTITRAQFARLLCNAFNLPVDTNAPSSFSGDWAWNTENNWAIPYIEAAKQFFNYSGDSFNPEANVSREQIAFALVRVLGLDSNGVSTAAAEQKYYKDWAIIDDAYKAEVTLGTSQGFFSGDGNGSFNPKSEINRAEMAVFLYRALNFGGGVGAGQFSDVKPGDWYYTDVMNLINREVISAYPDGTFRPDESVKTSDLPMLIANILDKPISDNDVQSKLADDFLSNDSDLSREQTAYTLAKLCDLAVPANVDAILAAFSDSSSMVKYRNEIASVVEAHYIRGSYNESDQLIFNPSGSVCRAELAGLLVHALPVTGSKANVSGQVFSDVAPTDWYYDGIMTLYNRGIVRGYPDGTFKPDQELTELIWLIVQHLNIPDSEGYDPSTDPLVLAYFPNNSCFDSKEAAAYAILKMLEINTAEVNSDDILASFNDKEQISADCRTTLAYLVSIGALKEDVNGRLNPQAKITRGEFAVLYAGVLNGVDKSKIKDYENTIVTVGLAAPPSTGTEKTMLLLEEDWRLTDTLDINANEENPLIIDGQNKYTIYEMNTSSQLMNSSGTVKLQNVRVINSGQNPAAGSLATLSRAAASISTIEAPARGASKLTMPTVPGFTVSIKSSSNEQLIALDGTINPQITQKTSNLVLALSGNGGEAYTASIPVTIEANADHLPYLEWESSSIFTPVWNTFYEDNISTESQRVFKNTGGSGTITFSATLDSSWTDTKDFYIMSGQSYLVNIKTYYHKYSGISGPRHFTKRVSISSEYIDSYFDLSLYAGEIAFYDPYITIDIIKVNDNDEDLNSTFEGTTWQTRTTNDPWRKWTIKFNKEINFPTISSSNIYITNDAGIKINTSLEVLFNSYSVDSVEISPESEYEEGSTYYLNIMKQVESSDGENLKNNLRMPFVYNQ